jgi:hypothetical protein
MVRLAQTVHLSYTKSNTISKRTKSRFYMTHVTLEFHRVRPKWFMGLWYVWCKLWIYLAWLTQSPNAPKRDSTWPTRHLGVPSGASKMISELTVRSAQTVRLSWIKISTISKRPKRGSIWALSPRSTIRCVQNDFWAYGTFGPNRAPILHQE